MPAQRWRRFTVSLLALVAMAPALPAQSLRVTSRLLSLPELSTRPLGEPHLAIHPSNPNHLLGAAMVHDPTGVMSTAEGRRTLRCAAFVSTDGGTTWATHTFPITTCFDPQVTFTAAGEAVFVALGDDPHLTQGDGMVVYRSTDGGLTWAEPPVGLGRGYDHPLLIADRSSPDRTNWLYVVSSRDVRLDRGVLRFVVSSWRSRTGGRTFDPEVRIVNNNLMHKAETPVVMADGTLMLSYVEAASDDGRTLLMRRRAWVVQSSDGGHQFSQPRFVNEACGGPAEGFRLSALAVDTTNGPFRDRLYFACNDPLTRAVLVHWSGDRGETWREVRAVHPARSDTAVSRKVMAMTVNGRGVLGVAWMEMLRTATGGCQDAVYVTTSADGGETFLPPSRVTRDASCPDEAVNGPGWMGDYFGMVSDDRGRFLLLWSGVRDRLLQLHLATIEVTSPSGLPR